MKQLYELLNEHRGKLNRSELEVSEYLLAHQDVIPKIKLHELAARCYVSTTTIIRLCKKLGFDGYKAVQVYLQFNQVEPKKQLMKVIADDSLDYKSQLILDNVYQTLSSLDMDILKTVSNLFCEGKRVDIYGLASSRYICEDLSRKLKMLGIWANSVYEEEMIHLLSSKLQKGDVVLVISLTGNNATLVDALKIAKKRGAVTVTMTNDKINQCAAISEYPIYVRVNAGSVSYNRYRPRYIFMIVIELLIEECIKKLDYLEIQEEQF